MFQQDELVPPRCGGCTVVGNCKCIGEKGSRVSFSLFFSLTNARKHIISPSFLTHQHIHIISPSISYRICSFVKYWSHFHLKRKISV